MSSRTPKIVMIGGFGWKDIGDEAMPKTVILRLKERMPEVDIVMLSPDPVFSSRYHEVRAVHDVTKIGIGATRPKWERFVAGCRILLFWLAALARRVRRRINIWYTANVVLDELSSADLIFNVGGGNINSVIPHELYKKCTLHVAAKILGKKVILSGQTMGPYYNIRDKRFAAFCLNRVDSITFRDKETSAMRLASIGVRYPFMADAADDSMTMPSIPGNQARMLIAQNASEKWMNTPGMVLGMNLKGSLQVFKGHGRNLTLGPEIRTIATLADFILEQFNLKILLIPTDYSKGVDDRPLHQEIYNLIGAKDRVAQITEEYDAFSLKGIISTCDCVIGARYHFNVFAASEHVPFLGAASGIYQQTKLKGLADLCEYPAGYFETDLEYADPVELFQRASELIQHRTEIREHLTGIVPGLKKASLLSVDQATDYLSSLSIDPNEKAARV